MSVHAVHRAMTDDERRTARALLADARPGLIELIVQGLVQSFVAATVAALGGAVLMAIALQVTRLQAGDWTLKAYGSFAILGAAWGIFTAGLSFRVKSEKAGRLADDVSAGVVEVLEVEAFIAWREIDREPAFSFDVAGEQPFFTKGAVLAPLVAEGKFPCRRFTLVRLPGTRVPVACEPKGEPLAPRA